MYVDRPSWLTAATALAGLLALAPAHADSASTAAVAETIAATCALRGLTAKRPIVVRPMSERRGGYTPGLGHAVWGEAEAERWRAGWCAVGIYCTGRGAEALASPVRGSIGLYSAAKDAVFVRRPGAPDSLGTIAHETVHALQYQNYPAIWATHPWDNRDLDSAVNTAIEGDAHLIGWWFRPSERIRLCVLEPHTASTVQVRRWQWRPQAHSAHEDFSHVFGPALALGRWLEGGVTSVNDLLRNPPLSSRDVLKGGRPWPVDFIALPDGLLSPELRKHGCERGLTNTVGALGIWGLLALHNDADEETAPALIDQWRGDRFVHVACPGERDDELAWVTRWRSADAARRFAERYRAMAASVLAHGGQLAAMPVPSRRGRTVVVVTPGLRNNLDALFAADVRTFADFDAWLASGCFPQTKCNATPKPAAPQAAQINPGCAGEADPAHRLDRWLARVRRAPAARPVTATQLGAVQAALRTLASLCTAQTGTGNEDFAQACNAAYWGTTTWLQRHCGADSPPATWMESPQPESQDDRWQAFAHHYGALLAEHRLAENGIDGLVALASAPPLSTLTVFLGADVPVDFIRMPSGPLAAPGCAVTSSHLYGALGLWLWLAEIGLVADAPEPPAFLLDWRGDRMAQVRCGEDEGSVWLTRWASEAAAARFASLVPSETPPELAAQPTAAGTHTVWLAKSELVAAKRAIQEGTEIRTYATFGAWLADGCFGQASCNQADED